MKKVTIIASSLFFLFSCSPPEIKIIPIENIAREHLRGLYNVNNESVWASGTKGTVLCFDGSKWVLNRDTSMNILDFRDIHAFNAKEAIIMSSGDGCEIYKTYDAAKTWKLVYKNSTGGIFFDGMDFWDDENGLAFSDPINDKLYIIETKDGGDSWQKLESKNFPTTLKGEAGFAASGTGLVCINDSTAFIGTGGGQFSRIFITYNRGLNWQVVNTPIRNGEASGIYSLTFLDNKNGVAVGGNYLDSASIDGNCAITSDGGLTWKLPQTPPTGYMSCVAHNSNGLLICTGRNGTDVSYDKGNNWKHISDDAYYSCTIGKSLGWLTGRGGKMARVSIK